MLAPWDSSSTNAGSAHLTLCSNFFLKEKQSRTDTHRSSLTLCSATIGQAWGQYTTGNSVALSPALWPENCGICSFWTVADKTGFDLDLHTVHLNHFSGSHTYFFRGKCEWIARTVEPCSKFKSESNITSISIVYQSMILSLSNDTEVSEPGHIIFSPDPWINFAAFVTGHGAWSICQKTLQPRWLHP